MKQCLIMFDYGQLAALAAVIRQGSFERAAASLHVTPSAISQRIRLLEERVGAVLIVRGQPCTATAAGTRLCQHAERVALLEGALQAELSPFPLSAKPGSQPSAPAFRKVRLAVNADSLATWFIPVMAAAGDWLFDLVLDDQDNSADWLRHGEVAAAVTAHADPVPGCDSHPLGILRYRATASPAFVARWFSQGITPEALALAPCLEFNAKDRLQQRWLTQVSGGMLTPPCHRLPSSQAFIDAALAGVGWGLNPDPLTESLIATGRLLPLNPADAVAALDVALYWQTSRMLASALAPLTSIVRTEANRRLVPLSR
jgi:LysR family transcriptional regulator, chromosome initiation inhibitor